MKIETPLGCWCMGTRLRKKSGSSWQGRVVGYYSTGLTQVGYAIESEREPGSVQIYPAKALEPVPLTLSEQHSSCRHGWCAKGHTRHCPKQ